jgi:hypothetical protein
VLPRSSLAPDQEPQEQSGPHEHSEQVQFGLVQPDAVWPHAQSGPQLHGEHVQLGLVQPPTCSLVFSVMALFLSVAL